MNENRNIVLSTINETKEGIENFRKELVAKGKQLPDIKAIAKSLAGIEKVIIEIKKLCNEETDTLQNIFKNLTYTQIKELLDKTKIMFDVINDNLLDGMQLRSVEGKDNDKMENKKEIWFEDKKVGSIIILDEEEDNLCIEVSINSYTEKFDVIKPYKMYHIISFINIKFNYE